MGREVGAGQAEVFQKFERDKVEHTARASRMSSAIADAGKKVEYLETMLRDSHSRIEEAMQLLSGSLSSVYALGEKH